VRRIHGRNIRAVALLEGTKLAVDTSFLLFGKIPRRFGEHASTAGFDIILCCVKNPLNKTQNLVHGGMFAIF